MTEVNKQFRCFKTGNWETIRKAFSVCPWTNLPFLSSEISFTEIILNKRVPSVVMHEMDVKPIVLPLKQDIFKSNQLQGDLCNSTEKENQ